MFITAQTIQAQTAYKQERTKREFRTATRREHAERAHQPEPRHTRRHLRPTTAA